MINKHVSTKYSALNLGYWMDYLIVANFAAIFLMGRGFNAVQIGYVTTISAILSMLLQAGTAQITDQIPQIPLRRILILYFGTSFLLSLVLFWNKSIAVTFAAYIFLYSLIVTVSPLLSALCIRYENAGFRMNYGLSRSFGSLGYAVCAYIMGKVTENIGSEIIVPIFIGITVVILLVLFTMPLGKGDLAIKPKALRDDKSEDKVSSGGFISFFITYKRYSVFVAGVMCCFFMQYLFATYMIYFAKALGGGESVLGTVLFVTAFSEIPSVAFGIKLMKKLSAEWMIRIFAIASVVKYAALIFITSITAFTFLHVIHFCYSGFYIVASVYFANSLVKNTDMVKAQAYMGVATSGITAMLANILGGYLIEYLPLKTILLMGTVISSIGLVLIFIATANKPKEKDWRGVPIK